MRLRFEKQQRYYQLQLYQDLLGDWIVERVNGRKNTALGRMRKDVCQSRRAAQLHLLKLAHYRRQHRYYQLIHSTFKLS